MKIVSLVLIIMIPTSWLNAQNSNVTITGGASLTINGTAPNQADVCADGRTGTDGVHFIFDEDATWCSIATPVTLVSFELDLIDIENVRISWTTSSEINNDYFLIHKSYNLNHWEIIAQINGHGTTTATNHYTFDDGPLYDGTIYYQLEQRDYDGTAEMFDIESIKITNSSKTIEVYPNPSPNAFKVLIDRSSPYTLMNIQGQEVHRATLSPADNVINLSNYPQGIYFLNLMMDNGLSKHFKLIKAN